MNQEKTACIFPAILLNARPGAGKSEIIEYLKNLENDERRKKYHIGKIHVIDDFPFLWRWFEEDHLLETMGKNRLFTDSKGYFKYEYLWDLLILMINLEYKKFLRDTPDSDEYTVILEFSRGVQHGGYQRAYPLLSDQILQYLAILYVNVSWEESLRKNRERFNPDRPDSVLEHGLPDEKLDFLYSDCDFERISSGMNGSIKINEYLIPFSVFENEDDVTTLSTEKIGPRLKKCMRELWNRRV